MSSDDLRGPPNGQDRPHVVLLGAGASRATFPYGDKNQNLVPLMDELPLILGMPWHDLIEASAAPAGNFEYQFSWLREQGRFQADLSGIEALIEEYFSNLELPEAPTIYDYLVMGLRPKDVIATFNWDPFLLLAHVRNRGIKLLPDIRFLHGSVIFTTCDEHDILGTYGERCPICRCDLNRPTLFFPDYKKDYAKDKIIFRDWEFVTNALKDAFHLTIFGYSGPETDFNARKLILDGWKQTPLRDYSHVEIIDIKEREELSLCWNDYIPHAHEMIIPDFWQSTLARWPRRTEQYKTRASLLGLPSKYIGPFHTDSLSELQDWFLELTEVEEDTSGRLGEATPCGETKR